MKTSGNTILITGGGSGIGRALAQRWHDLGNTVIVAGRTADSLAQTAQGRANLHTLTVDADDPADIVRFAREAITARPALNVLVNNAGIMRFEDISTPRNLSDAEAMVTTNLLGPIRMIDAFVDHLAGQSDATVINVSSGLAFVPMKRAATYSATKAAVHSYTVALRAALEGQIEVIEIVPPAVQTELTPGQSDREGYLPLETYIDQVMAQFMDDAAPREINVPNSLFLRRAEIEGRYDAAVAMTSQF